MQAQGKCLGLWWLQRHRLNNLDETLQYTLPGLVTNAKLNYYDFLLLVLPQDTNTPNHTHVHGVSFLLCNSSSGDSFCILNWLNVFHCTPLTKYSPQSCNLSLCPDVLLCLMYSKVCSQTRTQEIGSFLAKGNPSKSWFWTLRNNIST